MEGLTTMLSAIPDIITEKKLEMIAARKAWKSSKRRVSRTCSPVPPFLKKALQMVY
jgi:hypothetical protein